MGARIGRVIAASVVVLAACSSPVVGTAQRAPYRPLPLAKITARMAAPVEDALAYSPDGRTAVVPGDSSPICLVRTDRPAGDRICPKLAATVGAIAFSPDGTTLALMDNAAVDFKGGLWLISTDDGSAREVPAPTGDTAPSTGKGAAKNAVSMYRGMAWAADGPLVALVSESDGKSFADHLVRIDPATATAEDLGTVAAKDTAADGTLALAGHVAVLGVFREHASTSELVAFDLDTKTSSRVPVTGALVTKGSRILPLAVAPDGKRAALMISNPARFTVAPPAQVDLATGAVTVLPGTEDRIISAATYSPDGSELAIVATDHQGKNDQLLIAGSDGEPVRAVSEVHDVAPGFALTWTPVDLLVPTVANGVRSVDGIAPWRLSG